MCHRNVSNWAGKCTQINKRIVTIFWLHFKEKESNYKDYSLQNQQEKCTKNTQYRKEVCQNYKWNVANQLVLFLRNAVNSCEP